MEPNIHQIIQRFFKHLSERNLTELLELFSNDIDWYIPGDETKAPWLGKRNCKREVSDFYELLWKNTEPVSVNLDHVFIDNDKAVITGDFATRMLQTGKIVESLFFIQLTVQDNLIVKYRLLEDSLAVAKSLTA